MRKTKTPKNHRRAHLRSDCYLLRLMPGIPSSEAQADIYMIYIVLTCLLAPPSITVTVHKDETETTGILDLSVSGSLDGRAEYESNIKGMAESGTLEILPYHP